MESGKIGGREVSTGENRHGDRVPEHQQHRGRRGWRKPEATRFLDWTESHAVIRLASEWGVGVAYDRNEARPDRSQRRHESNQLFARPAIREHHHDIRVAHTTEIAVRGVGWMNVNRFASSACERRRNLPRDVAGFPDPGRDDLARGVSAGRDDLCERGIEGAAQPLEVRRGGEDDQAALLYGGSVRVGVFEVRHSKQGWPVRRL
jgi:hypothetical protein